jgi:hypothetical protein
MNARETVSIDSSKSAEDKKYYSIDYSKLTPDNLALLDNKTFDKLISLIDAECQLRMKELEEMRELVKRLEVELHQRNKLTPPLVV